MSGVATSNTADGKGAPGLPRVPSEWPLMSSRPIRYHPGLSPSVQPVEKFLDRSEPERPMKK